MSTVLVTGANRGLGLEFVRQYGARGWRILACCRSASDELNAASDANDNILIKQLDVSILSSISELANEVKEPIDVLVNNAGMYGSVGFAEGGVAHQAFGNTDTKTGTTSCGRTCSGP